MIVVLLSSIIAESFEELTKTLTSTISFKFGNVLIKNLIQIVECTVFEDNCNHYLILINVEFDSDSKTDDEIKHNQLLELVEMILENNETSSYKITRL